MNDYKPLMDALREQGWELTNTNNGHLRARPPDPSKPLVHFSAHGGDHRSYRNTISDLRKSGFEWPPSGKMPRAECVPTTEYTFAEAAVVIRGPEPKPFQLTSEDVSTLERLLEPDPKEDPMDQLWLRLKEAKGYLALADEHLVDTGAKLHAAQRAYAEAQAERDRAVERLREAKAAFDAEFDASAA